MNDKPADRNVLWDLPTRLFHWLLVCCLPLSWWSAEQENYDLHRWLGFTVIALVVSRVIWGVVGSRHSRFSDFVVGPGAVRAYVQGGRAPGVGHNPLGGWSVLAMLLLLLAQGISGLFNNDDVLFSGPLYHIVGTDFRDAMGEVHEIAFNALVALVCLHIAVVLYHQLRLREKLVQAMWYGSAAGREGMGAPASNWLALLILGLAALALWWGLELVPPPQTVW